MKMVKSLLLGCAAGVVAIAGAQAADLPVKAKPVEYVKVCSLYGAGFYYMPGTDICIKLGGYVRFQAYAMNAGNNSQSAPFFNGGGFNGRSASHGNEFTLRTRAVITTDTRQQTEFGTLRTYTLIGYTHDSIGTSAPGLYATRGFIQLAGFTLGKAQSFYDIFSNPAVSYYGWAGSDTGDSGILLAAYTAQFGNGFTGTISVEDPITRRTTIPQAATLVSGVPVTLGTQANNYGNVSMPDIVGVLRVDQAWGSAQVMAAAHQVRADYYNDANRALGHPDDKLGWVVGAGAIINTSFISPGDKFQFQVNYTEGAVRYLHQNSMPANPFMINGSSIGLGLTSDAVFDGNGTSMELTKGWGVNASYDHVWNQRWKTSIYGNYTEVSYSDAAKGLVCGGVGVVVLGQGCNPDWSMWAVGSRTQFNINSSTYLGLDVLYSKLKTSTAPFTNTLANTQGALIDRFADQDQLSATFRVHRDFLP